MSVPQKIMCTANKHLYSSAALLSNLPFILESWFLLALTSSTFSKKFVRQQAGFLQYFVQAISMHSNWWVPSLQRLVVWWYMVSDNFQVFSHAEIKVI